MRIALIPGRLSIWGLARAHSRAEGRNMKEETEPRSTPASHTRIRAFRARIRFRGDELEVQLPSDYDGMGRIEDALLKAGVRIDLAVERAGRETTKLYLTLRESDGAALGDKSRLDAQTALFSAFGDMMPPAAAAAS